MLLKDRIGICSFIGCSDLAEKVECVGFFWVYHKFSPIASHCDDCGVLAYSLKVLACLTLLKLLFMCASDFFGSLS